MVHSTAYTLCLCLVENAMTKTNYIQNTPKALVACEESQRVCIELRRVGIEAYSCDILECSGGHPEWHIQRDVEELLTSPVNFKTADSTEHHIDKWDLVIAHPPCTYLTVTGNRYFYPNGYPSLLKRNPEKVNELITARKAEREKAIRFFLKFTQIDCKHVAIENPVGVMSTVYRKPDCIIQPWQFGTPVSKTTCLWLKGLQPLKPTEVVQPNPKIKFASGRSMDPWYRYTFSLSPVERAKERSKTFPGVAKAMADTWGVMVMNEFNNGDTNE